MAAYEKPHYGVAESGTLVNQTASSSDTRFDSSYVDFCYEVQASASMSSTLATGQTEAWFHFEEMWNGSNGSYAIGTAFEIKDDSGNTICRMYRSSGMTYNWQVYDGSTYTTIGTYNFAAGVKYRFDIHIKIDATTGVIDLYSNDSLNLSFSGDTVGTLTGRLISKAVLYGSNTLGAGTNYDAMYSQMLWGVGASPTVGFRVFSMAGTSAGTHTQWTGAYTDVDDGAVLDGATQTAGTTGYRQTYNFPALPAGVSEYGIKAVINQGWGTADGGIDFGFEHYISATDYDTSAVGASTILNYYEEVEYVSPATAAAWTKTEVNGMESGLKAI